MKLILLLIVACATTITHAQSQMFTTTSASMFGQSASTMSAMQMYALTSNQKKLIRLKAIRNQLRDQVENIEDQITIYENQAQSCQDQTLVSLRAKRDDLKEQLKDIEEQIDIIEQEMGF